MLGFACGVYLYHFNDPDPFSRSSPWWHTMDAKIKVPTYNFFYWFHSLETSIFQTCMWVVWAFAHQTSHYFCFMDWWLFLICDLCDDHAWSIQMLYHKLGVFWFICFYFSTANGSLTSPEPVKITCPVCMDSDTQVSQLFCS